MPENKDRIRDTLADPDHVRRSKRFGNARLFAKWYDDLLKGKHVVAVVVSETEPKEGNWITIAYITTKITVLALTVRLARNSKVSLSSVRDFKV